MNLQKKQNVSLQVRNDAGIIVSLPENLPSTVTTKEKRLFLAARNDRKMSAFENDSDDAAAAIELLKKWKIRSGISSASHPADFVIIYQFLQEQFDMLTLYDLEQIVGLAYSGKMEIKKSDESFGTFSCAYVSRYVLAYLPMRKDIIWKVQTAVQKIESHERKTYSKDELLRFFKDAVTFAWSKKASGTNYRDMGHVLYQFITSNNLFEVTAAVQKEAKKFGRKIADRDHRNENKGKPIVTEPASKAKDKPHTPKFNKELYDSRVEINSKHYIVNKWLETITDINALLSTITYEMIPKEENL